jgi:hypothetical protein
VYDLSHDSYTFANVYSGPLQNLKALVKLLDRLDPKLDGADRSWVRIYEESARLLYQEIDYTQVSHNPHAASVQVYSMHVYYVKSFVHKYMLLYHCAYATELYVHSEAVSRWYACVHRGWCAWQWAQLPTVQSCDHALLAAL